VAELQTGKKFQKYFCNYIYLKKNKKHVYIKRTFLNFVHTGKKLIFPPQTTPPLSRCPPEKYQVHKLSA
jgi:hypothetical protein